MISQRLRGVSAEGEALEKDFVPKLKSAFGDIGVSIEDQNGELKSTYEILDGLASKWDTLSSKQKQYIGEKAAGNRQVKTLNAIMQNWDVVKSSIEDASEAAGTAAEGNELYMNSIEGRITQLQSAFQALATQTINSDFVGWIVSAGTAILNLTTNAGGLVPVLTSIAGALLAINSSKITKGFDNIKKAFTSLISGGNTLTGVLGGIGVALTAISVGIALGNTIYNFAKELGLVKKSYSELKDVSAEAKQNYSSEKEKLSSLNDELKTTQELVRSLEGRGSLSIVEQDDLKRLQDTTKELEKQIRLQEIKTENAERESRRAATEELYALETERFSDHYTSSKDVSEKTAKLLATNPDAFFRTTTKISADIGKYAAENESYSAGVVQAFNTIMYYKQGLNDAQEALDNMIDSSSNLEETLESNEYKTAEAVRDYWQAMYQDRYDVITKYQSEIDEAIGDYQVVENPEGYLDKHFNELKMGHDAIDNLLIGIDDLDKRAVSKKVLSKFEGIGKEINNTIKSTGDFTVEDLGSEKFSKLAEEFQKYGWSMEETAQHLKEMFTDVETSEMNFSVEAVGGSLFSTSDSKTTKDLTAVQESYKNLMAAMAEQQKAGYLTYETWSKLIGDKGLAGIENELQLTANGYMINTDSIYKYIDAMNESVRIDMVAAITERENAIKKLQESMEDLTDEEEKAASQAKIDIWTNEIEQFKALANEASAATSALEKYRNAANSVNEDAEHTEGASLFSDLKDIYKSGKVGTDDFKSGMDFLLGEGWLEKYEGDVDKAWKAAKKIGDKYFGEDDLKSANAFEKELIDKGFAQYDKETGALSMLTKEGDIPYTLGEIAEGLGITEDAAQSLFGLLNTYYADGGFEIGNIITSEEDIKLAEKRLEELNTTLETEQKKLEEMSPEDDGYVEQQKQVEKLTQDVSNLTTSVETAKEAVESVGEGESLTDAMSIDEAIAKIAEYQSAIETLMSQGLRVPVELTNQYTDLENLITTDTLDGPEISVTVSDADDAKEKIAAIRSALKYINDNNNINPVVKAAINEKGNTTIAALEQFIQEYEDGKWGEGEKTIAVSSNGTITVTIDQDTLDSEIATSDSKMNDFINKDRTMHIGVKLPEPKELSFETAYETVLKNIYQEALLSTKDELGQLMERWFGGGGDVDLTKRPTIKASKLADVGWEIENPDEIATLFSTHDFIGENGEIAVVLTPILPDGDVLSPETIDTVFENLFVGSNGQLQLPEGDWGFNLSDIIVSSFDVSNISPEDRNAALKAFGSYLSKLQGLFYNTQWDSNGKAPQMTAEEFFNLGDDALLKAQFDVEPKEDAGENLISQVQDQVDGDNPVQVPVEEEKSNKNTAEKWNYGTDYVWEGEEFDETNVQVGATVDEESVEETVKEIEEAVQNAKVDIPVDMTDSLGEGVKTLTQLATAAGTDQQQIDNLYNSYEALVEAVKQYNSTDQSDSGALQEAATNLQSASSAFSEAYTNLKSEADSLGVLYDTSAADQQLEQLKTLASQAVNVPIEADTSSASKSISSLGNSISTKRNMPVGADVSSARQTYTTFKEEIENTEVTMHVNMEKSNTPEFAKGTKRSKDQLALVDDGNGAELIEHKKQGTFELGTNDGPRLVELDEGDVVHTAEETKKILSRFGKIGNLFASGTKKKKKDTKNATKVTVDVVENREPTGMDGSSKSVTGTGKSTTTTKKKSSSKKKSGSSSSKKKSSESFSDYASKLYDWIEVKLDRLQEKTDRWIQKASEVTKVADKNKYLDKALKSVGEQIDANTKGQKKYLKQAAEVAKKGGLSDDMIKKIQEGSIEIGSYSSEMQTVIEEYKEWYDKAVECGDALSELKEQQTELATMKLDNIIDSYTNRVDYRSGKLDIEEQRRSYLTTAGRGEKGAKSSGSVAKELKASYKKSLETIEGNGSTKGTLYYLEQERKELEKSLNDSVSKGYIEKYSDEWYEYQQKIQDVSKEIMDYETQVIELRDAMAEIDIGQIAYKLDEKTRKNTKLQGEIDLNQAIGGGRSLEVRNAKSIQKNLLDSNDLLREQNKYYAELQKGLDPLSDKYQEYEQAIQANNEAINQNKIEYQQWQDTINELNLKPFEQNLNSLSNTMNKYSDAVSLATAQGKRLTKAMYQNQISNAMQQQSLNDQAIAELRRQQKEMLANGGNVNSDKYQELQSQINNYEANNRSLTLSIEEWKDAIEELPLTELGWSLDSITDKATKVNESISESIATGKRLSAIDYNKLVLNNAEQMKIYEEENKLLRQQQADILKNGGSIQSQEYQELEGRIRANESAMSGLRVSTAEYNDEIRKLKIQELTWDLNELKEAQDKLNQSIEYNKAAGIEQTAKEYNGLVASTQKNIANLQNQNAILEAAQQKILAEGGSKQSQKYQELEEQIRSNNDAINDGTMSIIGWKKEIYNLKVQKYIWQYDALERSISNLNHTINMNKSTGVAQTKDAYEMMSKITKSQIKDLQDQNSVLLTEQKGMDRYSDAYQEIQNKVRENLNSIEGLTEKLVEYQDAINQITIDNFTWQLDALTTSVDRINKGIDLNSAKGVEQTAQAYRDLIKNAEDQIKVQEKLIAEYRREQQGMDVNSEKYQELEKNIRDCESSITDLTLSTIEYTDSINKLPIQKLSWALEAINRIATDINDSMNLHEAQGIEETADTYEKLIKNGMQQIENLEQQNRLLKLQQVGLDENSEKWQEIQSQIDSNNSSINQLKVSQEQWNDAVIDLKINQLEKYKDQLSKANDQYQRQKELQEAIEELQKAQAQRTVRTYREGVGFVWEADQDQLKSAQEKLEDVIENQLLDKIDDLVEALEDYKNDTNVYDAQGNLLGTRYSTPNLESLGEILQSYYKKNELFPDMDNITSTFTQQLVEQVKGTGNTTTISFGDINLSDVNDINSFAAAIVSQLPNAILQLLNKQ